MSGGERAGREAEVSVAALLGLNFHRSKKVSSCKKASHSRTLEISAIGRAERGGVGGGGQEGRI